MANYPTPEEIAERARQTERAVAEMKARFAVERARPRTRSELASLARRYKNGLYVIDLYLERYGQRRAKLAAQLAAAEARLAELDA